MFCLSYFLFKAVLPKKLSLLLLVISGGVEISRFDSSPQDGQKAPKPIYIEAKLITTPRTAVKWWINAPTKWHIIWSIWSDSILSLKEPHGQIILSHFKLASLAGGSLRCVRSVGPMLWMIQVILYQESWTSLASCATEQLTLICGRCSGSKESAASDKKTHPYFVIRHLAAFQNLWSCREARSGQDARCL